MKDATCIVRDIDMTTETALVAGFVRVLDSYEGRGDDGAPGSLRLLVLCDEDEIVWRLCFEVVRIDDPRKGPCLTGLTYIGRWPDAAAVVFMHPPQRAEDVPWAPGRADMTRVTFSHPAQDKVLACLPCPKAEAVELGRLVLLEGVPANGETWFIARAFEIMRRRGYAGIVSFADPVPRSSTTGEVVKPGHIGRIYQASNAVYAGLATARTLRLLPCGRVFSERTRSKIRGRERGWQHAVEQLVAAGARAPDRTSVAADLHAWLKLELPRVTRPLKHTGNHRYMFALTPQLRRHLPASLPYPKITPA